MTRKVGRPRKEDARRHQYRIRLNDTENECLKAFCEEHKVTIADALRGLAMSVINRK